MGIKVRYVIYEDGSKLMLARDFGDVQILPRIGEEVCFCVPGYEESMGVARRIVHFPQVPEVYRQEAVGVVVEMQRGTLDHFQADDKDDSGRSNWAVYEGSIYKMNGMESS